MIDSTRFLRGAAALCAATLASAAQAIPFDYAEFVDTDGARCAFTSLGEIGTLPKASGIYPAGARVGMLNADCEVDGSRYHRTYVVSFPPGTFGGRAVTRERAPSIDAATLYAIVGIRLLIDPFIVGYSESGGSAFKPYHAFRYDLGTGTTVDLGTLAGPAGTSAAYGGSVDGSVVVGASSTGPSDNPGVTRAFRWTAARGMVDLGAMFSGGNSEAHGASDDGTIVVGSTNTAFGVTRAFRWTLTDPATGAGTFADLGATTLRALSVTPDGSVVVGQGATSRAFRWTQAGGATDLGALAGHAASLALGVSANGAVVVGTSDPSFVTTSFPVRGPLGSSDGRAFRWTQATGMQDLTVAATQAGADLAGVVLKTAEAVSRDGTLISGSARVAGRDDDVGYVLSFTDAATGAGTASATLVPLQLPTVAGPTVAIGASAASTVAGGTVQASLTVGPGGGAGEVSLSCGGLPAGASCTFSPARLTPVAGGSPVQLTIRTSTPAASVGAAPMPGLAGWALGSAGLLLGGAGMLPGGLRLVAGGFAGSGRRGRAGSLALLLVAAWIVSGCGGGGGSDAGTAATGGQATTTAPGTYAITIQATGSSGTTSIPFALTVR